MEDSLKPVEYTPDGGSVELPYHACGSTVPGEQDSLTTPKPGGVDAEVANSLALKFKHYSPRWSIGVSGFTSEEQCLQKVVVIATFVQICAADRDSEGSAIQVAFLARIQVVLYTRRRACRVCVSTVFNTALQDEAQVLHGRRETMQRQDITLVGRGH